MLVRGRRAYRRVTAYTVTASMARRREGVLGLAEGDVLTGAWCSVVYADEYVKLPSGARIWGGAGWHEVPVSACEAVAEARVAT